MLSILAVTICAPSQVQPLVFIKPIKTAKLKVESRIKKRFIQRDHIAKRDKETPPPPVYLQGPEGRSKF